MAEERVVFTREQSAYIDRKLAEMSRRPENRIAWEPPLPGKAFEFMGRPVGSLTEGQADPATDRVQPKMGPGHDNPEGNIGEPQGVHEVQCDCGPDDWVLVFDWFGRRYVSLYRKDAPAPAEP